MTMTPLQRLTRMRRAFAKNRSILMDDYEYFTTPRVPIPQSKAAHKSEEPSAPKSPKRN